MTRRTNCEDLWQELFRERHASLTVIAEVLLYRRISTDQILNSALSTLQGSPFDEVFGPVSALRAVVKAVVAHTDEASNSQFKFASPDSIEKGNLEGPRIGEPPWPEHAVHILRKVLHYSRRDTALLLGMSDANVDQLYNIAEKRSMSSFTHTPILPREVVTNASRPAPTARSMAIAFYEDTNLFAKGAAK
jgi:hypothetical protein